MPEFFNVLPPDEARALLLARLSPLTATATIDVPESLDRFTAGEILAPHALPSFRRSTMDGYAVRAADTFGASEALPAFLSVVGEVPMGGEAAVTLGTGEAAIVHTGGMIPADADAVVQIELTQLLDPATGMVPPFEIELLRAAAVGQHIIQIGEDVAFGSSLLPQGHQIRPQDIGALLALGVTEIAVAARPRVGILATGDEVIAPGRTPHGGQIRDINSYTVAALSRRAGGVPTVLGIVPDDLAQLKTAAANALEQSDMLVVSAGSSVSARDMTVDVIDSLGEPGVLLHGVATRPGKPTIVGVVAGKPVIGLPGNPVSAMVQFDMFGVPALYHLQGGRRPADTVVLARLRRNLPSETGREDYVPGKLVEDDGDRTVEPVFGKSNLIFTLVNADGMIKVPLNEGGLAAGAIVEFRRF